MCLSHPNSCQSVAIPLPIYKTDSFFAKQKKGCEGGGGGEMEQTITGEKKKMVSEKFGVTPDTEVKGQPFSIQGTEIRFL